MIFISVSTTVLSRPIIQSTIDRFLPPLYESPAQLSCQSTGGRLDNLSVALATP